MNTKTVTTIRNGFVLGIILCGLHTRAFATDVTGTRLDIGTSESLPPASTVSSICGGDSNTNNAPYSTIVGGQDNLVNNTNNGYDFLGGGVEDIILGGYSTLGGGAANEIDSDECFIGGGQQNSIPGSAAFFSTIAGGENNKITNDDSFIGGGNANSIYESYGVIGGGYFNTNSDDAYDATIGGGAWNLAGGYYSVIPGGVAAMTTMYGQLAHASGSFTYPDQGDAQASEYVLRNASTNTNSTELFLDGASERMVLPSNGTWSWDVVVSVRETNGNSGGFHTNGVIKAYNGTITMVGGVNPINVPPIAADVSSWKVSVSADTSNGSLDVKVNGDTSTNRWVATVRTTEVKF